MNLWPDNINTTPFRAPSGILKQQASELAMITKGIVNGEIRTYDTSDATIRQSFVLTAPSLGNYSVKLIDLSHKTTNLYPVTIETRLISEGGPEASVVWKCGDEKAFIDKLKLIFQNQRTVTIIHSILAMANA